MKNRLLLVAAAALIACTAAQAQNNVVKGGIVRYDTHSETTGIKGIGIPPGADAETGDATTLALIYERLVTPNFGIGLVLGLPPEISAKATGSVAFLGDDVLKARSVTPTLMFYYHFGESTDTWRPYVGAGINFTRFTDIRTTLPAKVELSDSWGLALTAGIEYVLSKQWSLWGSATRADVKTDLVATGSTVLTTTIDFKPWEYALGVAYKF